MTDSDDQNPSLEIALKAPALFGPPRSLDRASLQRWLVRTAADLGITATELAKAADLAASTINRFLRESEGSGLNTKTIEALVDAANSIENEYLSGRRVRPKRAISDNNRLIAVPYLGTAQRQHYSRYNPLEGRYSMSVPIRDPYYRQPIGFFEVIDDHGGDLYPHGSFVIVSPTNHPAWPQIDLKEGDHVVAMESSLRPPGYSVEPERRSRTSVRRVTASPSGELWIMQFKREPQEDLSIRSMDCPLSLFRYTQFFLIHTAIKPVMS